MVVTVDDLFNNPRLQGVGRCGNGWHACCPVHDDAHQSMTISIGDNGRILFHCKAGCSFFEIAAALGYKPRDLMGRGGTCTAKKGEKWTPPPKKKIERSSMPTEKVAEIVKTAQEAAETLPDDPIHHLAMMLGVRPEALKALRVGYEPSPPPYPDGSTSPPYWTNPELNAQEEDIGVNRRFNRKHKNKKQLKDTRRGLTHVLGVLESIPEIVLLPEGLSDVGVCESMKIPAIGRPGCEAGIEIIIEKLAPYLYANPGKTKFIFVGEHDEKADGKWPGKTGAIKSATECAEKTGHPFYWCMVPKGSAEKQAKDLRELVSDRYGFRTPEYYEKARKRILELINAETQEVRPSNWEENHSQTTQTSHLSTTAPSSIGENWDNGSFQRILDHVDNNTSIFDQHSDEDELSQNFPCISGSTTVSATAWIGDTLNVDADIPPPEFNRWFRRNGYCPNGVLLLLRGKNRMFGHTACIKKGCDKINKCEPCAARARSKKFDECASCFAKVIAAGGKISMRQIKRTSQKAVHKAIVHKDRGNSAFKDIKLNNHTENIVFSAPKTEDGELLPSKPIPGFVVCEHPFKALQVAIQEMDVSESTPVSSSQNWEYKKPVKEPQWKVEKRGYAKYARTVWAMEEDLQLQHGKLHGDAIEMSASGAFPPDWTPEKIDNAFKWWAIGRSVPQDGHAPTLGDYAEYFGCSREAA
jgi:hypothetical protein